MDCEVTALLENYCKSRFMVMFQIIHGSIFHSKNFFNNHARLTGIHLFILNGQQKVLILFQALTEVFYIAAAIDTPFTCQESC